MKITKILTSIFAFMAISCAAAGCSFGMPQNSTNGSNECKHTIVMDEAVAPTCGADGLTAGCHCST